MLTRGDVVIFQDTTECQAKQGIVVGRVGHGAGQKSCTTKIMFSETKELMVSGGESLFRLIDKPATPAPVCVPHVPSDMEVNRAANIERNAHVLASLEIENPIQNTKRKKIAKKVVLSPPQPSQRNPSQDTRCRIF